MAVERKYDLDERCVRFAAAVVKYTESMPRTIAGLHLAKQLLRSGTAVALHYGEVQSSESPADFIHKMKGALKELRESHSNMRVQAMAAIMDPELPANKWLLQECQELIHIFSKSIKTAKDNAQRNGQ